jgi:hypothetical protein
MTRTYTEQAILAIKGLLIKAGEIQKTVLDRGLVYTPKGYIYGKDNVRISLNAAVQTLAVKLEQEDAPKPQIKRTDFNWDKLNSNTQDTLFWLAERIVDQTKDAGLVLPARLGKDGVSIPAAKQPLITNLKKAGLVATSCGAKKSHRYIQLTEEGRTIALPF